MCPSTFHEQHKTCTYEFYQIEECVRNIVDVVNFTTVACRISSRLKKSTDVGQDYPEL